MLYPTELWTHIAQRYLIKKMEQMAGIEPAASAWKAEVLPLYDICIVGAEDEIRTRDPRLGKAMLYP